MVNNNIYNLQLKQTNGNAVVIVWAAIGVVNRFDRIILSSATRCSLSTLTALITVLPVPKNRAKPCTLF